MGIPLVFRPGCLWGFLWYLDQGSLWGFLWYLDQGSLWGFLWYFRVSMPGHRCERQRDRIHLRAKARTDSRDKFIFFYLKYFWISAKLFLGLEFKNCFKMFSVKANN